MKWCEDTLIISDYFQISIDPEFMALPFALYGGDFEDAWMVCFVVLFFHFKFIFPVENDFDCH